MSKTGVRFHGPVQGRPRIRVQAVGTDTDHPGPLPVIVLLHLARRKNTHRVGAENDDQLMNPASGDHLSYVRPDRGTHKT